MIALDGVRKSYGPAIVLDGITLRVGEGRRLALVGASGCGKSTLLRVVLGLITPEAGDVTVGGTRVSSETAETVRLRCGYVIQDGGLFPHLTAMENVLLVPRRRGWTIPRLAARADELFALAGLAPELGPRYPGS